MSEPIDEQRSPVFPSAASAPREESEYGLLDLLIVLARHKKLILCLPLLVAVVAAAISLLIPNSYKASTRLLPPQQAQSGAAALLSQLGGVAGVAASATGIKSPNDVYIGMLKSRTVADKLIARFDLMKVYDTDSQEKARKLLEENTNITAGKDGLMTIEVEDTRQKTVAGIANGYVDELLKLTKIIAVTEAAQRRLFFEKQLEISKNNLATAESTLSGSLDTRGVLSIEGASRAIIETVGRLRAQISAKEIQLSSMSAFVTTTNPEYLRANQELQGLKAELSKLENGRPEVSAGAQPAGKQVGLENVKILRDVKYYQMLYELLAKQYEVARLDEAKDSSVIQVLDAAIEPERKSKPRRAIIVLLSAVLALFASMVLAFVLEARKRALQSKSGADQWSEFKGLLRFK